MSPESSGKYETIVYIHGLGKVSIPGGEGFADRVEELREIGRCKLSNQHATAQEGKPQQEQVQEGDK